jgi:hypothetical protein
MVARAKKARAFFYECDYIFIKLECGRIMMRPYE